MDNIPYLFSSHLRCCCSCVIKKPIMGRWWERNRTKILGGSLALVAVLIVVLIAVKASDPTVRNLEHEALFSTSSTSPLFVDMGLFDVAIPGYGPSGHDYLYEAALNDFNNHLTGRKYLTIELLAYNPNRCGKIDDRPVLHAKQRNKFSNPSNCKFDESCGFDSPNACPIPGGNDNYYQDVARSINAVDDQQWLYGVGAQRFILNGDNEPSRCKFNKFNLTSYGTRFQPTGYRGRGVFEDNVYYSEELQKRFVYQFPNPAWQAANLTDLLCNVYCKVGVANQTCGDCGTTLDDYLLRYVISRPQENGDSGITDIHPFTGENCTLTGRCPLQNCHNYHTLHPFYAGSLGYYNATTKVIVPNTEAAEHICMFNVGYLGDCYGGHNPCSYNKWNRIEYTTSGKFFYIPVGFSSICRVMQNESVRMINAIGGSLTQRYREQVLSVDFFDKNTLAIMTHALDTNKYYRYRVPVAGELTFGMTPNQIKSLTGSLIDYIKTATAPKITDPEAGTPRGGGKYLDQPKAASPLTVNVQLTHPAFAFLSEDIAAPSRKYHKSARFVGKDGYHSRSEFYKSPMHDRNNVIRSTYSDYHMQNEWLSLFACIDAGLCTKDNLRDMVLFNWRLQFPNETSVQLLTRADIIDIHYKFTQDGWHWQTPGNQNNPDQLYNFASDVLANHPDASKKRFNVCMVSSGFDLERDGWVSSAWRMVSRCMLKNPRYNNPMGDGSMTAQQFWDKELYCGLRTDINDPETTDTTLALSTEHPHIYDPSSPTGYVFPSDDQQDGPTVGVIFTKTGNGYSDKNCAWDPAQRKCTTQAYNALPNVPCSPATPLSPYL